MELGIGMFGDMTFDFQTKTYRKPSERLKEIIEEVRLADELGIDSFAMGEHHREDYAVPSPEIVLAALSTATKNIRLSSGVNVISSTDPVKLFKDFTMIDMLSNHRAEIMAGRGSFIESFPVFGYNLQDYNELFIEKLELLLKLREGGPIHWQGKFRAPLDGQVVYPEAERKIPISIAVGGTPSSVERAANLGLPIVFAIIGGDPARFKPLVDFYREVYNHRGHDPEKMDISVHSHTFLGDSKEDVVEDYFRYYAHSMNKIGKERGWGGSLTPGNFLEGMGPGGALFMGHPDEVAEKIIRTAEMLGINRFIAHVDVGGPPHEKMMRTIERFGKEVMPKVKEHFKS